MDSGRGDKSLVIGPRASVEVRSSQVNAEHRLQPRSGPATGVVLFCQAHGPAVSNEVVSLGVLRGGWFDLR